MHSAVEHASRWFFSQSICAALSNCLFGALLIALLYDCVSCTSRDANCWFEHMSRSAPVDAFVQSKLGAKVPLEADVGISGAEDFADVSSGCWGTPSDEATCCVGWDVSELELSSSGRDAGASAT